ncbi:MAG: hypothetical protein IKZ29_04220 [Clostridiales bacterium]|nr:hypothetical protein [Clostridiales bacterium]
MKKATSTILILALLMSVVSGLTGCKKQVLKNWYLEALDYYGNGVKNGFYDEDEYPNYKVSGDLKNKSNKVGYLLYDLDGDGVNELLIGLIDNGAKTKFTSIVIYHSDLGPYCVFSGANGDYFYLCSNGIIKQEITSFRTNVPELYYQFDSETNSFTRIEGDGKYFPMLWELTEF